jgi:cytochrome c556
MNRLYQTVSLAACVLTACAANKTPAPRSASQAESAPGTAAPRRELGERKGLPPAVRGALADRMGRHGEQLTFLLADVVLLDYEAAAELADDLVSEPPLGRPIPGDTDSLNALLPAAFFDYQEQLRARAIRLGQAAKAKDRAELVAAFGTVAETCVGCHAAYLHDDLPAD